MDSEYKNISKITKTTAAEILKSSKLVEKLSTIGKVSIIESYKYDLMYGPDIDLIIETSNPRESALEALELVFHTKYFQKIEIGDFENFPKENRPKSYILVLKKIDRDVKWEIEIWFHDSYPSDVSNLDQIMDNITYQQKEDILKIKHQRASQEKSKNEFSSVDIYKGVIFGDKKDIRDF